MSFIAYVPARQRATVETRVGDPGDKGAAFAPAGAPA